MTDQHSMWTLRQMLCCCADKAAASDSHQEQSCNPGPVSTPDKTLQNSPPEEEFQIISLLSPEEKEEMYKRRINDLEQELTKVLKNMKALSRHLCEMGCLVFPQMDPCDSTCPSFVEKLKIYLECLQLERQQLEKRALWAEQTVWEIQNDVSDLEKLLHDHGYHAPRHIEHWVIPEDVSSVPFLSTQPFRHFFSKLHRKSPENKAATRSPRKWAEEAFGEVDPPKWSPGKDSLTTSPWTSPSKEEYIEAKSFVSPARRAIFTEHEQPEILSGAVSRWPQREHSQHSTARASVGHSDICIVQIHEQRDPHPERKQGGLAPRAEAEDLKTTSALPVATPSSGGSEGIIISPDSSVRQHVSPTLQRSKMENCNIQSEKQPLATTEVNSEIKRQGEDSTSKENKCVTLGSIPLEPVGLAGKIPENLSDAQTDPQKLDSHEAKTFQDLSGHATLQTEVSFPGKDSPESGQSINIVHSSNQAADLKPEQASSSPDLLQKLENELSSLELRLKVDLPSSPVKAQETNESLGEKTVQEDAPGLKHHPIPTKEDTTLAFPSELKPEELLLSDLHDTSTSVPQPASLIEESPSSLAEETAVEEN